jgi:tetratricopeptide (TPR) repeat protein
LSGHERELAESLSNLGAAYLQVGRTAAAAAVTREALEHYRRLPGSAGDLSPQLNNIAVYLTQLGDLDAAVTTAQLAVDGFRDDGATTELAMGLTNLGSAQAKRGQPELARPVLEEAVELYRARIAGRPELAASLASALNGLTGCLTDLGDVEGGLQAAEEAAAWLESSPSGGLVKILTNVAAARLALGRPGDALSAARSGADVGRRLSTRDPAYRAHLALALTEESRCALAAGEAEEAEVSAQEAVATYRSSARSADGPELARALSQLSRSQFARGRLEPALAATAESVRLLRINGDGDNGRTLLVATLVNAAFLLRCLHRVKEGIALLQEAVSLSPDDAAAWLELAEQQGRFGLVESGIAAAREAVHLGETVARRYLARALVTLGGLLRAAGRATEAHEATERALGLPGTPSARALGQAAGLRLAVGVGDARAVARACLERSEELDNRELADALSTLEDLGEPRWERFLAVRATLPLDRAAVSDAGAPAAIEWLFATYRLDLGRPQRAVLHAQILRHRGASPARFDSAWRAFGNEPPSWARIDAELYRQARGWVTARSVEAELAALRTSPRLLSAEADGAVAEALLWTDPADAEAMATRRRAAIDAGIAAAYAPALRIARTRWYARADRSVQLGHLDEAIALLPILADDPPYGDSASAPHPIQLRRAMALVATAEAGVDRGLLSATPAADPPRFATLLLEKLAEAWDPRAWTAVAKLAEEWALTPADRSRARVATAIALASAGDHLGATDVLVRTLTTADVEAWGGLVSLCARVARWEPTVAALLADAANRVGGVSEQ